MLMSIHFLFHNVECQFGNLVRLTKLGHAFSTLLIVRRLLQLVIWVFLFYH